MEHDATNLIAPARRASYGGSTTSYGVATPHRKAHAFSLFRVGWYPCGIFLFHFGPAAAQSVVFRYSVASVQFRGEQGRDVRNFGHDSALSDNIITRSSKLARELESTLGGKIVAQSPPNSSINGLCVCFSSPTVFPEFPSFNMLWYEM